VGLFEEFPFGIFLDVLFSMLPRLSLSLPAIVISIFDLPSFAVSSMDGLFLMVYPLGNFLVGRNKTVVPPPLLGYSLPLHPSGASSYGTWFVSDLAMLIIFLRGTRESKHLV